jgi:Fe2+/Zn2+ uptake regulation proteins|tara:strand:- start:647 stop:1063 length:417 start_codon:yes stop_codon:yes gene_type:complete
MENLSKYKEKLASAGLRATKQRLMVCKLLFGQKQTFHFNIEDISRLANKSFNKKISLATIYNTVNEFKKKGYLKEISLKGNKTFYDTNTKHHHHFYDEDMSQLMDIEDKNVSINYLPKIPNGKKIRSVEVLVKIEDIK